jgi:hypothetical protein
MPLLHYILAIAFTVSVAMARTGQAQSNIAIGAGVTTLRFAQSFESTVATSGLTLGAVGESSVLQGLFLFPVAEGAIDIDSGRGEILHGGGFHLVAQNLDVTFLNLIMDTTGATPFVTGVLVVNNAMTLRIPIFDAQLPPLTLPLDIRRGTVDIPSTSITLRPEAAEILNQIITPTTFTSGQPVGTSEMTWIVGQSGM